MSDENSKDWYDPNNWEDCSDSDNPFIHGDTETPFYENPRPRPVPYTKPPKNIFDTPKGIFEHLDSKVYGHAEFKRQLAFFVWQIKHNHRPAALLIAGNSGEGKTEMIRALQKIYRNIAVIDGASITPQGFKGSNKLSSGINLLDLTDLYQPPIYVIDEVDKLILRDGWNSTDMTAELLKLMEDGVTDISPNEHEQKFISTENISFILLGSFSTLTDKTSINPIGFNSSFNVKQSNKRKKLTENMIKNELSPELIGRIGNIIILEPFERSDFEKILRDERYSPIYRLENEYGINIHLKPNKRKQIAETAFNNQTGVRSMSNEISKYLMESLFENPQTKEITI